MDKLKVAVEFLLTPQCILQVSIGVLLIGRYVLKLRYINCFDIIFRHMACFKKANGKISFAAIFMYFGVPFFIAIALVKIRCIDEKSINIVTIIISILTSMLFTLLTLIIDMQKKVKKDIGYTNNEAVISQILLKEIYYAVMFEILLSVIILLFCFVELFSLLFSKVESFIIYYLTFIVVTNLLIVLKRIFYVINTDIDKD